MARDFIQREDWDNALAELERMLGLDGSNPTLHNQIGDLYLRRERIDRACEHFDRAIDLYAMVGLHNNAVALCKKVMRLRPGRHEMRYRLGRLRLDQGFRSEAAAFFVDWLDHVVVQAEQAEVLESRCREIASLLPDDAPVGKMLEKLEAMQSYACALEIVQGFARVATEAGNESAARRYTEKIRSLRVLAERNGGLDLLHGATVEPRLEAGPEPVALQQEFLAPPPGVAPPAAAAMEPALVDLLAPPNDAAAPVWQVPEPGRWELDPEPAHAGAASAPELEVASPFAAPMQPLVGPEQPAPVHEYDLADTASFDELAALLDPATAATAPQAVDVPAKAAWAPPPVPAARPAYETQPPAPPAPAWEPPPLPSVPAAPTSWSMSDLVPPPAAERSEASAPGNSEWIESLRHSAVWIPAGDALVPPDPRTPQAGVHMELENVIDSFREQMSRALDGDGAARYDLGVAYFEMGLYNEALAEFEAASRCPGLEIQSTEMLAACLQETGRHGEVIDLLIPVLAAEGHTQRGKLGLVYALARAFEALGDALQARRYFQEVARADGSFKDVRSRLERLAL
jgi:tetratricopeptide (TPR) repeat protein